MHLKDWSGAKMNALLLCQDSDDIGFTEAIGRLALIISGYKATSIEDFK
tara:strand:- start:427 stop:573 length:147 start_codon:yes stop_codon:yes gene_type:complete